jgi:predicted nucleic acid-binding protein
MAWGFDDEISPYANSLLARIPHLSAVVPTLWITEVTNALLVGERRKRITVAETSKFLSLLTTFPIMVDKENSERVWQNALSLARSHNLSTYDATYLELSIRLGLPIATLYEKLKTAGKALGVGIYKVS